MNDPLPHDPLRHPFLDWKPQEAYEDGYDDGRVGKMLNPFGRSQGELVSGATREQWVSWKRGNVAGHSDRPEVIERLDTTLHVKPLQRTQRHNT